MIERTVRDDGTICYTLKGVLHRVNGPARIWPDDGGWIWVLYGRPHRYYGYSNGSKDWDIHGDMVK